MSEQDGRARRQEGQRAAEEAEQPDGCMGVIGWALMVFGAVIIGRAVFGEVYGDWRPTVLWLGLGVPLLLFGLAFNGWAVRLCAAMAWTLPATILFGALIVMVDPGYASVLDGPENWVGSTLEARLVAGFLMVVGAAGLIGWGYSVRNGLGTWVGRRSDDA
ncbi:hypothetical protein [Actinomadura sp. HBU206391]|uniref:hypothetical protein n=1 Tax=Actinomadura sp. HBU206391 TaxID=2731692 RepID=UPI00164F5F93|nr:hypothetical protein [Actinomadura sp. HBU206391]MBC6456819.1 hypothetical protein [Actinomadura sp. HBU206391]